MTFVPLPCRKFRMLKKKFRIKVGKDKAKGGGGVAGEKRHGREVRGGWRRERGYLFLFYFYLFFGFDESPKNARWECVHGWCMYKNSFFIETKNAIKIT